MPSCAMVWCRIVHLTSGRRAAAGVPIQWTDMDMGFEAGQRTGHVITEEHLKVSVWWCARVLVLFSLHHLLRVKPNFSQAFEKHKVLFKGPLTIPPAAAAYVTIRDRKFTSANQVFRKV
jgi:hypothetical protein